MDPTQISNIGGLETMYVHGATVDSLIRFVNPSIPWIWILDHVPNESLEWSKFTLPISKFGPQLEAEYRGISCDIMMPTDQFLAISHDFDKHGIYLIQSTKRMPNSLVIDCIAISHKPGILKQNGVFLTIYLPHAVETAQIQCYEPGYLATKGRA